jgi:hypothetical protein
MPVIGGGVLGVRCSQTRISSTTASLGRGSGEAGSGITSSLSPCAAPSETACPGEDDVEVACCTGVAESPVGGNGDAAAGCVTAWCGSEARPSMSAPGARSMEPPTGCSSGAMAGCGTAKRVRGVGCACSEDAAARCTIEVGDTTEPV